jgi:hypothetical protein
MTVHVIKTIPYYIGGGVHDIKAIQYIPVPQVQAVSSQEADDDKSRK